MCVSLTVSLLSSARDWGSGVKQPNHYEPSGRSFEFTLNHTQKVTTGMRYVTVVLSCFYYFSHSPNRGGFSRRDYDLLSPSPGTLTRSLGGDYPRNRNQTLVVHSSTPRTQSDSFWHLTKVVSSTALYNSFHPRFGTDYKGKWRKQTDLFTVIKFGKVLPRTSTHSRLRGFGDRRGVV